ncbi:hypothetical protein RRG08_021481 [Elysia crispata]|uniref:Uncharacterized protein n=1 Tax=Elysia crispata TaxID=231223 RepID=A0AAE1BBV1_9GAST|nr:hypothetical protein RRG08_021481 [Elysia crispata]
MHQNHSPVSYSSQREKVTACLHLGEVFDLRVHLLARNRSYQAKERNDSQLQGFRQSLEKEKISKISDHYYKRLVTQSVMETNLSLSLKFRYRYLLKISSGSKSSIRCSCLSIPHRGVSEALMMFIRICKNKYCA